MPRQESTPVTRAMANVLRWRQTPGGRASDRGGDQFMNFLGELTGIGTVVDILQRDAEPGTMVGTGSMRVPWGHGPFRPASGGLTHGGLENAEFSQRLLETMAAHPAHRARMQEIADEINAYDVPRDFPITSPQAARASRIWNEYQDEMLDVKRYLRPGRPAPNQRVTKTQLPQVWAAKKRMDLGMEARRIRLVAERMSPRQVTNADLRSTHKLAPVASSANASRLFKRPPQPKPRSAAEIARRRKPSAAPRKPQVQLALDRFWKTQKFDPRKRSGR